MVPRLQTWAHLLLGSDLKESWTREGYKLSCFSPLAEFSQACDVGHAAPPMAKTLPKHMCQRAAWLRDYGAARRAANSSFSASHGSAWVMNDGP